MQFKPIPLVQAGGIQPYHGSTPQIPGPALLAMLAGRTAGGYNPMDARRAVQKQARPRARGQGSSLLDSLMR